MLLVFRALVQVQRGFEGDEERKAHGQPSLAHFVTLYFRLSLCEGCVASETEATRRGADGRRLQRSEISSASEFSR